MHFTGGGILINVFIEDYLFLTLGDVIVSYTLCCDALVDISGYSLFYLGQSKTSVLIRLHVYVVDLMTFTRQL